VSCEHGKESLLHADLTSTAAGRAGNWFAALLGAAAIAGITGNLGRHINGNAITGDGCFEIELQFVAEVRATEHLGSAAAATSTKDVTEHVTENITETFCTEAALSAGPTAQAVMPKLIVS